MGGDNHPTTLQWLTPVEHAHKTQSLDRETHNKVRRNAKKKAKVAAAPYADQALRLADEKTNFTVGDVKRIDTYRERNRVNKPGDATYPYDPEPGQEKAKVELTERQKAYRKAIYEKRKLARKKPHGWGKKKW